MFGPKWDAGFFWCAVVRVLRWVGSVRFACVCVRCARSVRVVLHGCALCAQKVNSWSVIGMEFGYFGVFRPQRGLVLGGLRGGVGVPALRPEQTVNSL